MLKKLSVVLLLMFVFTNAKAVEIGETGFKADFYGELHMGAFYSNANKAMVNNATSDIVGVGFKTRDNFDLNLYDLSRLGANLSFGNFTGALEIQANPAEPFRIYYVQYNFDNGAAIAVGQDWTPAGYSYDQFANVDQSLWDYGTIWELRQPQLRFSMHGLDIALIYADGANAAANIDAYNTDGTIIESVAKDSQLIPRVEASYVYEGEKLSYKIYGGYGRFSLKANFADSSKALGLNTYIAGVGIRYDTGGFFIAASGFFGENLYLYGALTNKLLTPEYTKADDNYRAVMSFGVAGTIGYHISDTIRCAVGAGYTNSSKNSYKTSAQDEQYSLYFNVPIVVAKYLTVMPEISYFDQMNDFGGTYQGSVMYYGVYMLASF